MRLCKKTYLQPRRHYLSTRRVVGCGCTSGTDTLDADWTLKILPRPTSDARRHRPARRHGTCVDWCHERFASHLMQGKVDCRGRYKCLSLACVQICDEYELSPKRSTSNVSISLSLSSASSSVTLHKRRCEPAAAMNHEVDAAIIVRYPSMHHLRSIVLGALRSHSSPSRPNPGPKHGPQLGALYSSPNAESMYDFSPVPKAILGAHVHAGSRTRSSDRLAGREKPSCPDMFPSARSASVSLLLLLLLQCMQILLPL